MRTGLLLAMIGSAAFAQVPYERIVNAQKEPGNWLTYSGNYAGQRYSPLTQLTPANAANLHVKWAYQFTDARTEVSPIVADGVMYVTGPNRAAALDVHTGRGPMRFHDPRVDRGRAHTPGSTHPCAVHPRPGHRPPSEKCSPGHSPPIGFLPS